MKKERREHFVFFKKLREYWKVPRYRSFIILGGYFVFFGCIFLYIHVMDSIQVRPISEASKKVDALTVLATMDNYEYSYEIEAVGISGVSHYTISGICYNGQDNFTILNDNFYVENDVIYSVDGVQEITDILPIDLLLIRPNQLYQALQGYQSANKVAYQNGEVKVTYMIPVSMFNVAFLQNIMEDNLDMIEIVTYERENQIYKIDLNLFNLMKLVDSSLQSYTLQIMYTNINNIQAVEKLPSSS